jgi:hypothetical protein
MARIIFLLILLQLGNMALTGWVLHKLDKVKES